MQIALWDVLTAIAPILAPIVSLILALIGKIIWNHEQRLRELEQSRTRHGRTLYGDDDDMQNEGISVVLDDVVNRLDRVETKLDMLNGHHDDWPGDDD